MSGQSLPGVVLFAIPIVAIVAGVMITWIKARHGLLETSAELNDRLQSELSARDEKIAEHEERIRVLERIVTDDGAKLMREMGSLSGSKPIS